MSVQYVSPAVFFINFVHSLHSVGYSSMMCIWKTSALLYEVKAFSFNLATTFMPWDPAIPPLRVLTTDISQLRTISPQ